MNGELMQQLLKEAIGIGDELLSLAERNTSGICWQTMSLSLDRRIVWHRVENLYNGVSGIALFFLELYRETQRERYLQAAVSAMDWVQDYCEQNPTNSFAFFTGRMGVVYVLLRMTEVTEDGRYLETASTIARPCSAFVRSPDTLAELINGLAGTVLGLLHLHAATGEGWIVDEIDTAVERLIRGANHGPVGLYWDRSAKSVRGLCGFSHGAAGVGFVFLELGRYFQNELFYWIAEQAFVYEGYFYDESIQNWPDFRKSRYTTAEYETHKKAYLARDLDFFTSHRDMSAWCHGAAGIGLSRLRAFEHTKSPVYAEEVRKAIAKTITINLTNHEYARSPTLCHGAAGNAELFLEAYKTFQNEKYLALARKTAHHILGLKKAQKRYVSGYFIGNQEDTSLFMGNAGIGYFYLKALRPHDVPSILLPKVKPRMRQGEALNSHCHVTISMAVGQRTILKRIFKRTLFALQMLAPEDAALFFEQQSLEPGVALKADFVNFVQELLPALSQPAQDRVHDIFSLELEKMRMDEAIRSNAWLKIKEEMVAAQAQELTGLNVGAFLELKLVIDADIKIVTTAWPWRLTEPGTWADNLNREPDVYPVLLRSTTKGITETPLSPLAHMVLTAFQSGSRPKHIVRETAEAFDVRSKKEQRTVSGLVIQQIHQMLLTGILVEDSSP